MNILHINNYVPPLAGGTEVYLERLCIYFNNPKKPHTMHTCSLKPYKTTPLKNCFIFKTMADLKKRIKQQKIQLIVLQNTGLFDATLLLSCAIPIVKIINDYDLFSTWSGGYNRLTLQPSTLPFKSILNPLGHITRNGVTKNWENTHLLKKLKTRKQLNSFYKTLVFTKEMQRIAQKAGIKNTYLFPHGTPEEKKSKTPVQKVNRVQFSAALYRGKGIHLLCELAKHLKQSNIEVVITGDGPMSGFIKDYSQKHHLSNLHYKGRVPREELNALLETSKLFCITSIREALGLNGMEAMSYATPVVAFDVGGIPTWLKHNKNGVLIKPFDTKEMANTIIDLIHDETKYNKLSQQALKDFNQHYNWKKVVKKQEAIFQSVINNYKN